MLLFALDKEFLVADIISAYQEFGIDISRMTIKRRLIDSGVLKPTNKVASTNKGKGGKPAMVYTLTSDEVTFFKTVCVAKRKQSDRQGVCHDCSS